MLTGLGNWSVGWKLVEEAVRRAEELGFWGVIFPDQNMWDKEDLGVDSYENIDSTLDVWVALSNLAARTSSIRLGTWVTPIPLRPPALLAKMVSTLDVLSEGRSILGVGAGITKRLFDGYSEWSPPKVRVDKTREGVELILKLWGSEAAVDFEGVYYKTRGTVLRPKPVQKPHPPLLFGGAGRRMSRLAGRYADICYVPPWNKMDFSESKETVVQEARRNNREGEISFAYGYTPLGPGEVYDVKAYAQKVEEAEQNGFEYFITAFAFNAPPWDFTPPIISDETQQYLTRLAEFSKTCISSFAK